MRHISHTVRAILPYPSREALAGAIDGVAGAVVGTEADLSADPPIPATRTDLKTQTQKKTLHKTTPHLHSTHYLQVGYYYDIKLILPKVA